MPLDFLYTGIGRGHPFYLDGIREALPSEEIGRITDVFVESGMLSRLGWQAARWAYRVGSSSQSGVLYSSLRRQGGAARNHALLHVLMRDLRSRFPRKDTTLLVAHPLLVRGLDAHPRMVYQHGELAVPDDAILAGPHTVLVPDRRAADRFVQAGMPAARVFVSGLCIEKELALCAETAFAARLSRLQGGGPLCGLFFSSGAEPVAHVKALASAAASLAAAGHRAVVLAASEGRLLREVRLSLSDRALAWREHDRGNGSEKDGEGAVLVPFRGRRALQEASECLVPVADFCAGPAHERSHWALGLGLPHFITGPDIGTFAPLNRARLLEEQVAKPLESPGEFGKRITAMRGDGSLEAMMRNGRGRYPVDGFSAIAGFLQKS